MTDIQVEKAYINTHTISHHSRTDVPAFRPYSNGVFKWTMVVFVLKQMNCCCMCRPVLVTPLIETLTSAGVTGSQNSATTSGI